jgi:hypothetical protein
VELIEMKKVKEEEEQFQEYFNKKKELIRIRF